MGPASSSSPRLPILPTGGSSSQLPGMMPNISQDQLPPILPSMQCPDLAEAASKISLLSPEQFQSPPVSTSVPSNVVNIKQEPTFSGNSSPSREVAGILDDCVKYEDNSNENDEDDEEEEEERAFQNFKATPTHNLNTNIKFPTPPAPSSLPHPAPAPALEDMERRLETLIRNRMEAMEMKMEARSRTDQQAVIDR